MALFPARIYGGGTENKQANEYDVTSDGRFVINTVLNAAAVTLLMHWQPDTKK